MIARAANQTPDPVPGRATPDAGSERVTGAPECPKCGGRMWLARIEPEEPGYDRRTFECPECDHSLVQVVKYK